MEDTMNKPAFTINPIDISSANLGWTLAQLLLATMVKKKVMTPNEAKAMVEFCVNTFRGNAPERALIKEAALTGLELLRKQYTVAQDHQPH
jgi:hypothetical protein